MKKGFTLIELIVVIALIGILAIVIFTVIDPATQLQKATDTQRKNHLALIQKALEAYYNDHNAYPLSSGSFKMMDNSVEINWGTPVPPYIDLLPKDPSSSKNYVYWSDGQTYRIYASLDRGAQDPQACNSGAACTNLPGGASCGSGTCNYGVTSSNTSP